MLAVRAVWGHRGCGHPARTRGSSTRILSVNRDSFDVPLGALRAQGHELRVVRRGKLERDLVVDVDCRVPEGAEAVADVVLRSFEGGITVTGVVSSTWLGECRRCLRSLEGEVVAPAKEIFRRGAQPDEGVYSMDVDQLNLREMVLDSLFGALPVLPLCRDGCLGICPVCGEDRNVSSCRCEEPMADPRWSVLDSLREEGG